MSSEKWDQERSRHFYFNSDWVVWCPEACEGEHPIESTYTIVRASPLSGANIEHIKNTGVILAWTKQSSLTTCPACQIWLTEASYTSRKWESS